MPLRHCTCAQSLPRDGPPHSKQDVRTDPKIEITFSGLPVELVSIPGHSNSGSISQIKAMISSFLLSQGGCAHMWFLWDGCTHAKDGYTPTSQHWDFNVLSSNLSIPLSPTADEDLQWWKSAHNVLRGVPVTPTNQTLRCSRMHRTSAGEYNGMH